MGDITEPSRVTSRLHCHLQASGSASDGGTLVSFRDGKLLWFEAESESA